MTVALDGLRAGVPEGLYNAIDNAGYNKGAGLSFIQKLAYGAA